MIVKGQIKTCPLQQWSVVRAFNLRIKRKIEAGLEIPVPQMHVQMTRNDTDHEAERARHIWTSGEGEADEQADTIEHRAPAQPRVTSARDVSHEPQAAPLPTEQSVRFHQIPTASEQRKG